MNFLVYKRPSGAIVYINPDNFIRLVECPDKQYTEIKYRHACDDYCTETIDSEYGVKIVQFKEEIGGI